MYMLENGLQRTAHFRREGRNHDEQQHTGYRGGEGDSGPGVATQRQLARDRGGAARAGVGGPA